MDISDWRKKIDELDRKLVDLLSQRAHAAHEIGKLKLGAGMPIYEPDRERNVFNNVRGVNAGPLPDRDLLRIYERIMDVMRQIQQEEIAPSAPTEGGDVTWMNDTLKSRAPRISVHDVASPPADEEATKAAADGLAIDWGVLGKS